MQDIKAREAYLRQQRDHLIKKKDKARAQRFESHKKGPAKSSPSKAKTITGNEQTSKNVQAKATQSEQDINRGAPLVNGKKMSNSGVLCSAIADKLRIEQN